ncbi:hypothetical protein AAD018_005040 [Aestuariibius insulae]|uniref:hypothetical protein n=1 Tax=Aestuariibius insulae TaxID=2058287 RepID=UPI00345F1270
MESGRKRQSEQEGERLSSKAQYRIELINQAFDGVNSVDQPVEPILDRLDRSRHD